MPSVMDRLFPGRKARTPETIEATLAAARDRLANAQARAVSAANRRAAAIAAGDRSAAIAAEAERGAAGVDIEIAADEVAGLEKGLADAVRAAEAEARAALVARLVARRKALGALLATDWPEAASVLAGILSEVATLARDVSEANAEREVERLPEVDRGLPMHAEAVRIVSTYLEDSLSGLPLVPESPNEATFREHRAGKDRDRAEAAEARRIKAEAEREEGRAATEAEDAKARRRERYPFYGMTLDVSDVPDAAR